MHIGIGACLGMWTFGLIMIFGYTAYVPAEFFHRFSSRLPWGQTPSDPSHPSAESVTTEQSPEVVSA